MKPRPNPHTPSEGPTPSERLRAWLKQWIKENPVALSDVDQRAGVTRRQLLGWGAAGMATTALGLAGLKACNPKGDEVSEEEDPIGTVETPDHHIDFFGHPVEILDQAHFDAQVEKARQYLLLKYSTPGKIVDENGEERDETKQEYWTRALETEFRDVLVEMDRYRDFIEGQATALGVSPDILAFFGIEAGFDPLKRSPSDYCGIAQIGVDAVRDVRDHTDCSLKIMEDDLNLKGDWYDRRYHPLVGIANGVAYIGLLQKRFPKTVRALLQKHRGPNKKWLESKLTSGKTRLETFEAALGLPMEGTYETRYQALIHRIVPENDVAIADPGSFAICAYNMGETGVARQMLLNFMEATTRGTTFWRENEGVSALNLSTEEELLSSTQNPDSIAMASVASLQVHMGYALRESDDEQVMEERSTYLWQAYVFREIAAQWMKLRPGEAMKVPFKGKEYRLEKPTIPLPTYQEEMASMAVLQVPIGTDLVRLAEHLALDEQPLKPGESPDHFTAFRRCGNASFVRGIAVTQAPPKNGQLKEGLVKIRIPKTKVDQARAWLEAQGPKSKATLHRLSASSAEAFLKTLKARNPEQEVSSVRIFWQYNRMGNTRMRNLKAQEWLVLPGDLSVD